MKCSRVKTNQPCCQTYYKPSACLCLSSVTPPCVHTGLGNVHDTDQGEHGEGDYNDTGTSAAAGTALLVVDLIVDSLPPVNCFISHGSGIQRLYQLQAQKFTLLPGTGATTTTSAPVQLQSYVSL